MTNNDMDEKLKKITNYFGIETELMKLSEEIGELQNECYRMHFIGGSKEHIEDEMADSFVILLQICLHFGLDMDNIIKIVNDKADRTTKRIEEGWYDKHR